MNLENIPLSEKIKNRLVQTGYQKLTDVQLKVIPLVLEKKDVVVQSRTGTGKTAAFLIPIFDADFWKQKKCSQPQVLILEPTRELALQVSKEAQKIAPTPNELKILTVYGQSSIQRQADSLKRGVDIVTGTLGRTEHHLKENNFQINNLKFLVLDEVDEMINEDFLPIIEWIIKKIPPSCQILLFSATSSSFEVKRFAERFLKKPLFVTSQPEQTQVNNIQQYYLETNSKKNQVLIDLINSLNREKITLTLVFVNTKRQVEFISKVIGKKENLKRKGLIINFLHGGLRQRKRITILERFQKKQISLLVVTDVLGRGIHVDDVDYVINYDIPQNPASYTHRIGRTGRAESKGVAITLVNSDTELRDLQKIARRQKFKINEYKANYQKDKNYSE